MAKLVQQPTIQVETVFTVSEKELHALDALAGYGDDAFIKMFYKDLGEAYMKPHEAGLREFLQSVRSFAPSIIRRTNDARKAFNK